MSDYDAFKLPNLGSTSCIRFNGNKQTEFHKAFDLGNRLLYIYDHFYEIEIPSIEKKLDKPHNYCKKFTNEPYHQMNCVEMESKYNCTVHWPVSNQWTCGRPRIRYLHKKLPIIVPSYPCPVYYGSERDNK